MRPGALIVSGVPWSPAVIVNLAGMRGPSSEGVVEGVVGPVAGVLVGGVVEPAVVVVVLAVVDAVVAGAVAVTGVD